MPLGTLDRTPPPFFRQGASALSKLTLFSALALFLMVADTRFGLTGPVRTVVATVLYPLQWTVLQPVLLARSAAEQLRSLGQARDEALSLREQLQRQSVRAQQFEQLALENERLRKLLALRERPDTTGTTAQVLYDAADPYAHKLIIDKGAMDGISAGAPVIDEAGVLGQITRVYPSLAEVTLLIDANQAIPVLNTRTGVRALAYGKPQLQGGGLELRYMAANADVQAGDLLSTSGIDGVFPPGLPVARVDMVERGGKESSFAQIDCSVLARVEGASHVLVLPLLASSLPERPIKDAHVPGKKARDKERAQK